MDNRSQELFLYLKSKYETGDPSHDMAHILRVMDNCKKLGPAVGADMNLVYAAALLHDIVNVPKNHVDREKASAMAAAEARPILIKFGYTEEEISKISAAILEHSYSRGLKPSSIESAVVQDSDRLDSLGAIGIMRTVTCGALMKAQYYDIDEPIAKSRNLEDRKFTIDHFFVKLFKLRDLLNTEAAKEEADRRIEFMNSFLRQLQTEIPKI